MTDIIKRNGQKEPFSEEKVRNSVESAVEDSGLKVQAKRRLINKTMTDVKKAVENKDEISTAKIRNIIINDFEQDWEGDEVPVARAWRNYELKHGIIYKE